MLRKIILIDEDRCNGCGRCAAACHEGAIEIIDGKAKLTREDYCDGLGDCLPACPVDAIRFEVREAPAYDEAAVLRAKAAKSTPASPVAASEAAPESALRHWPVQLKLAPLRAPFYQGADLLIAADCTAYAYAAIHRDFMAGRITLIACPKLDSVDYSEKLSVILKENNIRSVTVLRMEVPCCGGIAFAAQKALLASGRDIPFETVTVTTNGNIRK